jgi:hypothetical protein
MFDPLDKETEMQTSMSATIAAAHSADLVAAAERRRTSRSASAPRFARVRAAWHARRAAPQHIGQARAA